MFWNITADNWAQLWGSLLGSLPSSLISACVAAFVAVNVLNRSNAKQHDLTLLQLDEQRKEATKAREIAAAADLLAHLERLVAEVSKGGGDGLEHSINAAFTRWMLDADVRVTTELGIWKHMITKMARDVQEERSRTTANKGKSNNDALKDLLVTTCRQFDFASLNFFRNPTAVDVSLQLFRELRKDKPSRYRVVVVES